MGGEEFGFVFSALNSDKSFELLELIRHEVERLEIEHNESDVSKFLTISLGAQINQGNNINATQLYIKADEALYESKVLRNHVVIRTANELIKQSNIV